LAALFSLDSFGSGFFVQSLLALWLFEHFGLSLAVTASFFFWTGVLSALSFLVAVRIARRIGLVNTMVFTHLPSSLCLVVIPFVPDVRIVLALLLFRAALSQMDVPTRSSYVRAFVTPPRRAAAASITAVPRGVAAAASAGLGREVGAAVVEQVELDAPAAPHQLMPALLGGPLAQHAATDEAGIDPEKGLADIAREGEVALPIAAVEIVEEDAADPARLVAVLQEKVFV